MSKFGYLAQADVKKDVTREYPITEIEVNGVTPTFIVKQAGEKNTAYFNALLKRMGRSGKAVSKGKITAAMIAENRDEDRELYPRFVIEGWKDVYGADGQLVKYTPEDCSEFLAALPDYIFDDLRTYCSEVRNFVDGVNLDIENTGKN